MIILYLVVLLLLFACLSYLLPDWAYAAVCTVWCFAFTIQAIVDNVPVGAFLNGAATAVWAWVFWRKRPPGMRKKISKAIGAKARAIKEKLIASMPQAKPVFVPVPA